MKLLAETWFYMIIGVIAGFLFPSDARSLIYPILFVLMCFSLTRLKFEKPTDHEKHTVVWLVFLNYLASAIIIVLTLLLVKNPDYQKGLFVMAIMPPAISIIPWTSVFKGNLKEAMAAEIVSYFLAIIVIPTFIFYFIGAKISMVSVAKDLIILLFIPFLISRHLRNEKLASSSQLFINLCFMVIFYITAAINRDIFLNLSNFSGLAGPVIISAIVAVVIPTITYFAIKNKHERPDFVFFSCMKNGGLALVIIFAVLPSAASVPATIDALLSPLFFIYISWLLRK